jgi:hypothetical protein
MNTKQNHIFYFVRDWCLNFVHNKEPDPFFLHITGGAGTGKSHLIKCIYNEASQILKNAENPEEVKVLLTAPTGTAAYNIGGFTIHSALKIPPKAKYSYEPLSNDTLNTLQCQLAGLRILIIDEISMVDSKVLAYIHGRLRQIKQIRTSNRQAVFGGVCILAVGDFYQLPPVKAKSVCISDSRIGNDLWNDNFQIIALDEIMRQKDDMEFANILNSLRTKQKCDVLDPPHEVALMSRNNRPDTPNEALHVFARNRDVDEHNLNMLQDKCSNISLLKALDYSKDPRNGTYTKLQSPKVGNTDDLADTLTIGIGAKVMLLRNVDVTDGLFNGAMGTVVNIVHTDSPNTAKEIHVRFANDSVGKKKQLPDKSVVIELHEETFSKQHSVKRRQFPLKLAWACTIHKVQGMTVEQIVYDMEGTFASGQAYVALSRVTSLQGLFLKNLNAKLIYRDEKVHAALQEMPVFHIENHSFYPNAVNVVHHNVQGLRSKHDDLLANSDLKYMDIIAVTESWLSPSVSNQNIALPGYDLIRNDRSDGRGGVALYVSNSLQIQPSNVCIQLEHCAVQVNKHDCPPLLFVAMYRSPRLKMLDYVHQLQTFLALILKSTDRNILIAGDFNEDPTKDISSRIMKTFCENGFEQLVNETTTKYGSMLDLAFFRASNVTGHAQVIPAYYSDHEQVHICIGGPAITTPTVTIAETDKPQKKGPQKANHSLTKPNDNKRSSNNSKKLQSTSHCKPSTANPLPHHTQHTRVLASIHEYVTIHRHELDALLTQFRAMEPVTYEGSTRYHDDAVQDRIHPCMQQYYQAIHCPADGNCLYHAMSISLTGSEHISDKLRKVACLILLDHRHWFEYLIEIHPMADTFETLLQDVWTNNNWGNEYHILALSIALERPIFQYTGFRKDDGSFHAVNAQPDELAEHFLMESDGFRSHYYYGAPFQNLTTRRPLFCILQHQHFTPLVPFSRESIIFTPSGTTFAFPPER